MYLVLRAEFQTNSQYSKMNPTKTKEKLESLIQEIEDNTQKFTMQTRALLRALVAGRRICEKMQIDEAILSKQGKEYFEATLPAEKKPIKFKKIKND